MNMRRLVSLFVAILTLVTLSFPADARDANEVRARSHFGIIGFVGCDMHAPRGPEVALIQIAAGRASFDPEELRGMPCADALVRLQSAGVRLGASRVIPGTATSDPDCLAWDLVGPEVYDPPSDN